MTNATPAPRDWRRTYRAALLEHDPTKLPQRIADARHAILDQVEVTLAKPHSSEHQDMYDALHGLRSLCANYERQAHQNLVKRLTGAVHGIPG